METLKSGDAPALVANIEVMEILGNRISGRNDGGADANNTDGGSNVAADADNHRDWIEKKVYEYLSNSPCGRVSAAKMPQLVSTLRREGPGTEGEWQKKNGADGESGGGDEMELDDDRKTIIKNDENAREGFGLTDAETLQVLNMMPVQSVDVHLLIEDLPSRMSEDRQNELMETIGRCNENTDTGETGEEDKGMCEKVVED